MAGLSDRKMLCYNRQIILRGSDFGGQEVLKGSHVLMMELDDLGYAVSQYLANAGADNLMLLGFDTVSLSDL